MVDINDRIKEAACSFMDVVGVVQAALYAMSFHERAWRLMLKRKPFLVVSITEKYYPAVYRMIRESEKEQGTWTKEDEKKFDQEWETWS